jgi:hypothetical protein
LLNLDETPLLGTLRWRIIGGDILSGGILSRFDYISQNLGNGIDCYRTWEALIMGAVPIVLRTEILPLYEDMPIMIVDKWTEVTRESLRQFQLERLQNFSRDGLPWRPKIWLRYWINQIETVRSDYVVKYCNKSKI